jgi:hypothetical protein
LFLSLCSLQYLEQRNLQKIWLPFNSVSVLNVISLHQFYPYSISHLDGLTILIQVSIYLRYVSQLTQSSFFVQLLMLNLRNRLLAISMPDIEL